MRILGQARVGFGDPKTRLWIVGLAPAAHGANCTGRMFTGDKSGQWLYDALFRFGFSDCELSRSQGSGLKTQEYLHLLVGSVCTSR
jgi:uracil-DNA glycosylase